MDSCGKDSRVKLTHQSEVDFQVFSNTNWLTVCVQCVQLVAQAQAQAYPLDKVEFCMQFCTSADRVSEQINS